MELVYDDHVDPVPGFSESVAPSHIKEVELDANQHHATKRKLPSLSSWTPSHSRSGVQRRLLRGSTGISWIDVRD